MRTTVDIDPDLLEAARHALGTEGVTKTVNAALAEVSRHADLRRFDVRVFDITDEDIALSRRDRIGAGDHS